MNKRKKNNNHSEKQSIQISLYPILAVNFVGTLGFGIVLPFLVFLVTRFGGNAFIYGIMGATYSAFQLIGAPILGNWSDRFGRRKILLLSQLGTLFSWLIFLLALFLPLNSLFNIDSTLFGSFIVTIPLIVLFVARALDGITGGNVSVANAYLADISSEEKRSENFGKMAVAANLGFIIGPGLASLLGDTSLGELLPVMAALLISFVASLIIAFWLPESKPEVLKRDPEAQNVRKLLGQDQKQCFRIECKEKLTFWDVVQLKNARYLLSIYFLVHLGFNFFYISFPVHAVKALEWSLAETGIFFAVLGIFMALVQGPLLGKLSKTVKEIRLMLIGSLILALSFLFYISATTPMIYTGALLLAFGNGIMWPSLLSLLSKSIANRFQGAIQGFAGSAGSIASIIGLFAGGILYEQLGEHIFSFSAVVVLMTSLLSFIFSLTQNDAVIAKIRN